MSKAKLLFAGDFAPCRGYENFFDTNIESPFKAISHILKESDWRICNLECPLTTRDVSIVKDGPSLRADPKLARIIHEFDAVSLANNHAFDFGIEGVEDTIRACNDASIDVFGVGHNLEQATRVNYLQINGLEIAIIAACESEFNEPINPLGDKATTAPLDPIINIPQIEEAKKKADYVIMYVHGGNEYFQLPRPGLRRLCKLYVDLGCDAVICHHSHVPGAHEVYKGKPIVYSLGNFLFDNPAPPSMWDLGYLLEITLQDKKLDFKLIPIKQSINEGGVKLLDDKELIEFESMISNVNESLRQDDKWINEWERFVSKQELNIELRLFSPIVKFPGFGRLLKILPLNKLLVNKINTATKLNVLRCQSHLEVVQTLIEKKVKK